MIVLFQINTHGLGNAAELRRIIELIDIQNHVIPGESGKTII
jgi:hypothetical protein